jgi:hypothetical protein
MRTINEIWQELQNHPDFATGTVWTKQNVIDQLEGYADDEDFNRISELFYEENKSNIISRIANFEATAYDYGCHWTEGIEDLIEEGSQKIFSYDSEIA